MRAFGLLPHSIAGVPAGYMVESAAVAYVSKRSFSVGREAQCIYGPGQPLVLLQDGKFVPASVVKQVYNGATTVITTNVAVSSNILGVAYDASAPIMYCADSNLQELLHFESLPLADSAQSALIPALVLQGSAPTLNSTNAKFGGNCFQLSSSTVYRNTPTSLGTVWSIDFWVYGQPTGYLFHGRYDSGWGYNQAHIYFNAGVPQAHSSRSVNSVLDPAYAWDATSSIACVAGQHNHVAICWDVLGYRRIYVNGALGVSTDQLGGSRYMCIFYAMFGTGYWGDGGFVSAAPGFTGIIDEMRVVNGACPFNGPFTVPTKPGGPDWR